MMVQTHLWRGAPLYEPVGENPLPPGESWSMIWHWVEAKPPYFRCSGLVSNSEDTIFYANLDDEL